MLLGCVSVFRNMQAMLSHLWDVVGGGHSYSHQHQEAEEDLEDDNSDSVVEEAKRRYNIIQSEPLVKPNGATCLWRAGSSTLTRGSCPTRLLFTLDCGGF